LLPLTSQLVRSDSREREIVGVLDMINQERDELTIDSLCSQLFAECQQARSSSGNEFNFARDVRHRASMLRQLVVFAKRPGKIPRAHDADLNWNRNQPQDVPWLGPY